MADEDIDNIKYLIALNRRTIRTIIAEGETYNIKELRKAIRRLKRQALELGVTIADTPGIDFDDEAVDRMVTVKLKLSVYNQIRTIVAQHGINLPELE